VAKPEASHAANASDGHAIDAPCLDAAFDLPQFRTLMGTSSLGIIGESLGQESQLAEFFGVKEGVLVRSVNKDSAAEKAGMKAGDVIVKVDDTAISTPQQISSALRGAR
jgi:serine protease Do